MNVRFYQLPISTSTVHESFVPLFSTTASIQKEEPNLVLSYTTVTLPYFVSSKETAFSMDLLKHLDSEFVIGQLSYMHIQ